MSPFNLSTMAFAWLPILPLIAVSIGAMVVMLAGVRVEEDDSAGLGFIALVALLAAFVLCLFELGTNTPSFHGALVAD
ncbi:MAG TPA: hypothetical protein VJN94_10010, partial [Candidatus Binataceae bacterium]|nr:hypothetical protein [Candidatus Binataceae bacterium]